MAIRLKRSTTAGNVPSSLLSGEVAINEQDRYLFSRDGAGNVKRCLLDDFVEQNVKSVDYTTTLGDAYGMVYRPSSDSGARTYTIAANATVAYDIGTTITFVNRSASALSIAIASDTMYLAGSSTTGTRTLGTNGMATALKTGTTEWIISGAGLT